MINIQSLEHTLNDIYANPTRAKTVFKYTSVENCNYANVHCTSINATYNYAVCRLVEYQQQDKMRKADFAVYFSTLDWDNEITLAEHIVRLVNTYINSADSKSVDHMIYATPWGNRYTDANGDPNCYCYDTIHQREYDIKTEAQLLAAANKKYAFYNTVRDTAVYWRDSHYDTDADIADAVNCALDGLDNQLIDNSAYNYLYSLAVTAENIQNAIEDTVIKEAWTIDVHSSSVTFTRGQEQIDVQYIRGIEHQVVPPLGRPFKRIEYKTLSAYDVAKRFLSVLKTFPANNEVKAEVTMWEEDDGAPKIRRYTQEQLDNFKFCDSLI